MNPIIYLPIELQAREFESKVLLAAILTERGFPVVFGQQWMMYANLDRLPAGVFLSKSFNRFHQPAMRGAKRAGHRVFAMEEEMLAVVEEKAVAYLCNPGIFDIADVILTHGRFEHDMLRRLGGAKARIEIAGNGRLDLLKTGFRKYYRRRIDEITQRYGDFVLVNTNFATLNSIWKSVENVTELMVQGGFHDRNDPQSMKMWHGIVESERANQAAMLAAVRELARRRPTQAIVVRPHPGEDLSRWDGEFAGLPNVAVVREGAHVPWTLASRVLLHTSCTTGFEAFVAGTPALSLVPRPGWLSETLLSNKINPVFSDPVALVEAAETILDGRSSRSASAGLAAAEDYVWNSGASDGTRRIAELLTKGLPDPNGLAIPSLSSVARDEVSKGKFLVSLDQCREIVQRIAEAAGLQAGPRIEAVGESLFVGVPARAANRISVAAPQPAYAELRAAIETACRSGNYQKAYDTFKQNQAEAHRHPDLCFFAGVALFETGRFALALQYFQHAALANGGALDPNVSFWTARTHQRLGELELACRHAEQACRLAPIAQDYFDLFKELALRTGKEMAEHWIVIGCSHVRYFRFMQLNQLKFFAGRVHLECHEFGGATAYGLGSTTSQSGALNATRQLRARIAQADRVLIMFGEVDCRRAAWKAAAVSGQSIEETIAGSVSQLENYVRREVLPHNRAVLIFGAKPQIIADEDFYKNALIDERIVFKPLGERERITAIFNAQAREAADRLDVDYTDLDHLLADEKSRRQFFKKVFWDTYTTDTHGNVDYLARLYFERLQEFL